MTARPMFGFPIYNDYAGVSVSGGSWLSTPTVMLSNVLDPRLGTIARSSGLSTGSTTFTVDLGSARPISIIAIPRHNLSINATVRVTATGYDSGAVPVNGVIYPVGVLPATHPSFATRKLTAEEFAGYNIGFTLALATPVVAQNWTIAISDTGNPDGFVDVARVVLAAAFQPSLGAQRGYQFKLTTSTTSSEVDSGATYYKVRPVRRVQQVTLDLPVDEMLSFPYEMMRKLGVSGQLYFVFDPSDVEHLTRRSFLCTMRQLNAIEWPYTALRNQVAFELLEVL